MISWTILSSRNFSAYVRTLRMRVCSIILLLSDLADMKRSSSAPMISEIAEAGIRPQFDHPRVYCASALTNLTVDTGVTSASRPLVCILTYYYSLNILSTTFCIFVMHFLLLNLCA